MPWYQKICFDDKQTELMLKLLQPVYVFLIFYLISSGTYYYFQYYPVPEFYSLTKGQAHDGGLLLGLFSGALWAYLIRADIKEAAKTANFKLCFEDDKE